MELQVSLGVEKDRTEIVGINWGSTNFRAYRIASDGTLLDEYAEAAGVARLDRSGMAELVARVLRRWPGHGAVVACGMIGSNIGWQAVPYANAPASLADVAAVAAPSCIGAVNVLLLPGIRCRRAYDGGPDMMRGEELELFGFVALHAGWRGLVALPGTHTKWAWFDQGRITDFFTSMSGELFDRLTSGGLLASIVDGEAVDGPVFLDGVSMGCERKLGLATLLFGARARVISGQLDKSDAASYIRGLVIGAEIADALAIYPNLAGTAVPLIGNGPLCKLYRSALAARAINSYTVDSKTACLAGFHALRLTRAS
jgi:2-dehydro-3-deoxygalactonokinase